MDPNLPQNPASPGNVVTEPPKDLKTKITETSNEFVKDNYEGFLRKLVNIMYSLLKFIKNSLMSMINMALNRD